MRIAKPILLVSTPIGVAGGLFEALRLAGGLVVIMLAMLSLIGIAFGTVIVTARREEAERRARSAGAAAARSAPQKEICRCP